MALRSQELAGDPRLEQAALGPPSLKPQPVQEPRDAVARLQVALVKTGDLPSGFADQVGAGDIPGLFGRQTTEAVKAFQRRAFPGQPQQWDGFVGKGTLAKLDAAMKAGPAPGPVPPPTPPPTPRDGAFEDVLNGGKIWESFSIPYDVVDPVSVSMPSTSGRGLARFTKTVNTAGLKHTRFRFTLNGETFWLGVAVPDGVTACDMIHVFFHPAPGQAGHSDSNYASWGGNWEHVYRYVPWLGSQLAQSGRPQVLVVPLMSVTGFQTLGFLRGDPIGRLQALMNAVAERLGVAAPQPLSYIGASSFSVGISALQRFCAQAGGSGLIRELFDFDGASSNAPDKSVRLAGALVRRYHQGGPSPGWFAAPDWRWAAWPPQVKQYGDVHALMPNLFQHAVSLLP